MMTPTTDADQNNIRDDQWLQHQLSHIWDTHFADVAQLNTVTIAWGRATRTRLGSLNAKGGIAPYRAPEISHIRINPLLQDPAVPVSVVWQTIAHEVAHYTHGFCSPHPQKYRHPHQGGVIEQELHKRQLTDVYNESQAWLKDNWPTHVTASMGPYRRKKRRRTYVNRRSVSLLSHFHEAFTGRHRRRR